MEEGASIPLGKSTRYGTDKAKKENIHFRFLIYTFNYHLYCAYYVSSTLLDLVDKREGKRYHTVPSGLYISGRLGIFINVGFLHFYL